jgi:predicted transcriptional regulator
MARASWFDEKTESPLIEEQLHKLESFTKAMADGIVETHEVEQQQDRLVEAMRAVESELSDAQHEKVTRLLAELTAFNIMKLLHELHAAHARETFSR